MPVDASEIFHEYVKGMTREYLSLVLLVVLVVVSGIGMIVLSHLVLPPRSSPVKQTPYESRMPPIGTVRERLGFMFHLARMPFIVLRL